MCALCRQEGSKRRERRGSPLPISLNLGLALVNRMPQRYVNSEPRPQIVFHFCSHRLSVLLPCNETQANVAAAAIVCPVPFSRIVQSMPQAQNSPQDGILVPSNCLAPDSSSLLGETFPCSEYTVNFLTLLKHACNLAPGQPYQYICPSLSPQ